jgi:hypothetical protein
VKPRHTHEAATIEIMAAGLNVPPEAVRYACNAARITIQPDGGFLLPTSGGQRARFFAALASRPENAAERLLWDLGRPSRRLVRE